MGIKKRKTKKGFTVIEAIISLVLFTMIMIPLGSFTITAIKNTSNSAEKQKAMDIAQSIVEQIKAVDSKDIDNLSSTLDLSNDEGIKVNEVLKNKKFNGYSISGEKSGFHIEGNITPNEAYVNKDENKDNKNFDYYVYIDDNSIEVDETSNGKSGTYKFSDNIDLSKEANINICEEDGGSVNINGRNVIFDDPQDKNCNIKILYKGEGKSKEIKVNLKNLNPNSILSVYCYKKLGSNMNFNTITDNTSIGMVRIYNNMYEGSSNKSGSSLFDIHLKISKNNKLIYEINSTKVIKE